MGAINKHDHLVLHNEKNNIETDTVWFIKGRMMLKVRYLSEVIPYGHSQ